LFKLHLKHTAVLTPDPGHLRGICPLVSRSFSELVVSTWELKTTMLSV